ncbi:hypothetical protein M432DRAFT_631194 [Thermoascus aurantiacus ATCC 26904]
MRAHPCRALANTGLLSRTLRPRIAFSKCARSSSSSRTALVRTRLNSSSSNPTTSEHQHGSSKTSPFSRSFWTCRHTWKRAAVNTARCLIGCTSGDFSSMWLLQTYRPELGMGMIMPMSMAAGLFTSLLLETLLLRLGPDRLPWPAAARTATGMSLVSMATMEAVQNLVDYHLTGGVVALEDPRFWAAAGVSMAAGFLAPLPYNYVRLRRYGRGCH